MERSRQERLPEERDVCGLTCVQHHKVKSRHHCLYDPAPFVLIYSAPDMMTCVSLPATYEQGAGRVVMEICQGNSSVWWKVHAADCKCEYHHECVYSRSLYVTLQLNHSYVRCIGQRRKYQHFPCHQPDDHTGVRYRL
jgi:hypothetical protein